MRKNISVPFAEQVTSWLTRIGLRSLRVRLALWGLLLLGVTQIIVSVIIYLAISTWLENQVDSNLLLTATQVSSVLSDPEEPQSPLDINEVNAQLANDTNIASQSFLRDQLFFVRLVDLADGTVLGTSADYAIPVQATLTDPAHFITITFHDNLKTHELRIYTLPLSYAPELALQTGISLEETREIQTDVRHILIRLLFVTGTLASLSGWFLANRALVPIRATIHTATEINATDLSRRLDLESSEVELEELVQTFNAMLTRIEEAFHRQRQFTADAAHELRTPLSIMQTGLEVTLSQPRSILEYQASLVSVQEEVQRLSQLARTLLMLARTDVQEVVLDKQPVNFSLLLNALADQFDALANEKGLTLVRSIPSNLIISGDEDRLIQVVYNLLDNAMKYTPTGGEINLLASKQESEIVLEIRDTGSGIPQQDLPHIFNRFYRVDHARTREQGGFGLGLAIVKRIVDLHQGHILVTSGPGQGTTFQMTLPR